MHRTCFMVNIMANTYSQVNIHAVFSVKGRKNLISESLMDELCKVISGKLLEKKQYPLAVGGYKDHIHVFFELTMTITIAEIMDIVKTNSSKWINDNRKISSHFEWQKGYAAFSYSKSQRDNVIKYIIGQKNHHKKKTFREEYMELLKKFEIKYEDAYLFEFYE